MNTIETAELVTIGELVRLTNSRYSTLKYYVEEGLLPFAQEDEGLTRRFKRVEALTRLNEIKSLKEANLSISEIKAKLCQDDH